jgi:ATP-dependent HslUV protease ATP-binding subunit HslU
MTELTPREIVSELDRYIVGQKDAKRAVAIALRNRWRRKQVSEDLRGEIVPKNILMIGPTGVGKTEIARRLAKLARAPFIKVEATKFTEVGYVGRDVESIIRDLVEISINQVRERVYSEVKVKAEQNAEERILDALVGSGASEETRKNFKKKLKSSELDDKDVELDVKDSPNISMPTFDIPGMPGGQMGLMNIGDVLGKALGGRTKKRSMPVAEGLKLLISEESDKLSDQESLVQEAIKVVENDGIVFLDEVDKIASRSERTGGDVSREGVQRDLLPLLEGTMVSTKYGPVSTDHILFIASGAFHLAKPSDLLPEMQGRLPIRVELKALTKEDMIRVLTEPEASLTKQYVALLKTEGVDVTFTEDGVEEIAELATRLNREVENIGARRLHTVMEKLLEEISFTASDLPEGEKVKVNAKYVNTNMANFTDKSDLSKFIL